MRKRLPKKILITGGAGFIGSFFARLASESGYSVAIIDKLTYAADCGRLKAISPNPRLYKADILDRKKITGILAKESPEILVNFSAQTHVDRSILEAGIFLKTNIQGTHVLLEAARRQGIKRFVHISTDEVYGQIIKGRFKEDSPLQPNSPYAASKAAADLLVRSYLKTYNLPLIIVRPSNNYGPWQYPEKFIPLVIYKALRNEKIPVYAAGLNIREWLYVQDCASAVLKVAEKGSLGQIYNIGSGIEIKNIAVAKTILDILGKPRSLITFVRDRPGHDFRYSLDSSRIRQELGWRPEVDFEAGLSRTVSWYVQNIKWLKAKARYLSSYWKKVYR